MATNEAEVKAADPAAATARYQLRELLVAKAPDKVQAFDMRAITEHDALVFVCYAVVFKAPATDAPAAPETPPAEPGV